jgi:hypothetical protein
MVQGLGLPKELANGRVARRLASDELAAVLTSAWRKKQRKRNRQHALGSPALGGRCVGSRSVFESDVTRIALTGTL